MIFGCDDNNGAWAVVRTGRDRSISTIQNQRYRNDSACDSMQAEHNKCSAICFARSTP
jgi:hypothetical protein